MRREPLSTYLSSLMGKFSKSDDPIDPIPSEDMDSDDPETDDDPLWNYGRYTK